MPREIQNTIYARARRHYCPLVFNTIFLEEDLLICPPLTFIRVFTRETPRSPSAQPTIDPSRPQKIPKPPGEVTRLKRGGYTLQDKLCVSQTLYKTIQKDARTIAMAVLEPTKRFNRQTERARAEAIKQLETRHPILRNYEEHWPCVDFFDVCQGNIATRGSSKKPDASGTYTLGGSVRFQSVGKRNGKGRAADDDSSSEDSSA